MASAIRRGIVIPVAAALGVVLCGSALYRIEFEGWTNERARSNAHWGSGLGSFEPDSKQGRFLLDHRRRLPADDRNPPGS